MLRKLTKADDNVRFLVLSTSGKTSTVARILALLIEQACRFPRAGGERLRIALAAPTGKAAARLQESIRQAKQRLRLPTDILERIPEQAATLHRLLGSRPDSSQPAHNHENPLSVDALILDEASMIDVALMAKLLLALPRQARLVGYALRAIPEGRDLPWQRVINARGEVSLRGTLGAEHQGQEEGQACHEATWRS